MSRQINQPINQVRLTNVAVVRMSRHGKRFEIACYRNKVVNYRQGLETDLSEVLQTDRIFTNVSKGQFAKKKDLLQVFGTADEEDVARRILNGGTVQVSDREREERAEHAARDVATWVSENCVHPVTQRPYTPTQVREAMRKAAFAPNPTKSIKRQYLECVKLLQEKQVIPIERAKMELHLLTGVNQEEDVQRRLQELQIIPTSIDEKEDELLRQRLLLVDPALYRPLDELVKTGGGRLEIVRQVVRQEEDANLELELERRRNQQESSSLLAAQLQEAVQLGEDDLSNNDDDEELHQEETEEAEQQINLKEEHQEPSVVQASQPAVSARKSQKKAQKKSKKARRREKEEEAERQARIDAERQGQQGRAEAASVATNSATSVKVEEKDAGREEGDDVKSCNTCGGSFASATLYRAHFRSDWHRYNIKLKMKGQVPVSEDEFRLCDADAFFEENA